MSDRLCPECGARPGIGTYSCTVPGCMKSRFCCYACMLKHMGSHVKELDENIHRITAGLKDPHTVHVNTLRGTIAKMTDAQVKHTYPHLFTDTARLDWLANSDAWFNDGPCDGKWTPETWRAAIDDKMNETLTGQTDKDFSVYEPEFVTIRKDWIYHAQESLRFGIEAMQELLAHHDLSIGRDRPRGKREAEQIERNIAEAETRVKQLNDAALSDSGGERAAGNGVSE